MSRLQVIPLELNAGHVIFAEIVPMSGEREVASGTMKFDSVVESIAGIAQQLNEAIASVAPDKATVEFSLQLSTQSGKLTALLVQGAANATLKVTLEWKRESADGNK